MEQKYTITNPNFLVEELDEKYLRMLVNVKGKLKELINTKTTEDLIECCEDRPVPPVPSQIPIINCEVVDTTDISNCEVQINTTLGEEILEEHIPASGFHTKQVQCELRIATTGNEVHVNYGDNNFSTSHSEIIGDSLNINVLYNGEYVQRQYLHFSTDVIERGYAIYKLNNDNTEEVGYYEMYEPIGDKSTFAGNINNDGFKINFNVNDYVFLEDVEDYIPEGYYFVQAFTSDSNGGFYVVLDIVRDNQNITFDVKVDTAHNICTITDNTNVKPENLFIMYSDVAGFTKEPFTVEIEYRKALVNQDMTFEQCWNYITNGVYPILKVKDVDAGIIMYYLLYIVLFAENYPRFGRCAIWHLNESGNEVRVIYSENYFGLYNV